MLTTRYAVETHFSHPPCHAGVEVALRTSSDYHRALRNRCGDTIECTAWWVPVTRLITVSAMMSVVALIVLLALGSSRPESCNFQISIEVTVEEAAQD